MSALVSPSLLHRVKTIIPRLDSTFHKGQAGRIGIVGGSEEYTGAPYYAAISTLRCGADLAFVFCGHRDATIPIKAYSPELIVYPSIVPYFNQTLARLSSVVFGPGLGRSEQALEHVAQGIALARENSLPIVLDGDALWLVKDRPELVRGYTKAILTPNLMEFNRLLQAAGFEKGEEEESSLSTTSEGVFLSTSQEPALSTCRVANWLGGVTILRKGKMDVISNGHEAIGLNAFGSSRRCGGQGDVLAGTCGVFANWAKEEPMLAAFGAALLTRRANSMAFHEEGRSMVTPDLIRYLGKSFRELYESETCAL